MTISEREIDGDEDFQFSKARASYQYSLLREAGDELCSQCNCFVEIPVIAKCGHLFCKDCLTSLKNFTDSQCPQCLKVLSSKDFIILSDSSSDVNEL